MSHLLARAAAGMLCGALAGLAAFESVSVLYFGLGLYSQAQLTQGALVGLLLGALGGPCIHIRRMPLWGAALGSAAVWGMVYLLLRVWMIGGRSLPSQSGAWTGLLLGLSFVVIGSAFAGAATAWLTSRLPVSAAPPTTARRPAAAGRYHL